ncbi:MAG: hypothetical protein AWU59_924 [Methanolobus sp. T82-4]|jgi:MFS superfamily sulfate permease-like transporter|nr:MAG: hypothetical protein AWU59_924 [Methanolobus sp. T82-4]
MQKHPIKERILHFATILIVCILLGYLTHDLLNGMFVGIAIGIGFVMIGEGLIGNRR